MPGSPPAPGTAASAADANAEAPPGSRPSRPVHRPLADLSGVVPGLRWSTPPAAAVTMTGLTHDSRSVQPGDLYAALPGSQHHGADFAGAAAGRGAVAILTDPRGARPAAETGLPVAVVADPRAVLGAVAAWAHDHPAITFPVIGITGTNGKTTTAYLVEAGLRAAGHVTGLLGTIETRVAGTVIPSVRTTPEAPDLQALFAVMRERAVTAAVMEVSSHALALGRVDGTVFATAVFTNLSQDHLDFHGDLASYFAAKAGLFTSRRARQAVLNVDDGYGVRLATMSDLPVTSFSAAGRAADWRAGDVRADSRGSSFSAFGPDGLQVRVDVGLPGAVNVANALGALASLTTIGVSPVTAAAGIATLPGVPGRLERVEAGQPFTALVDYAHTPEAVATLLATLRPVTAGRLVIVLGCGGDRDVTKRPLMGAAAVRGADFAVLTSDNPRTEDPLDILAAMEAGARAVPGGRYVVEADRATAIALAVSAAGAGDTVVVAGKGHEQGQDLGDRTVPFDDRAVLAAASAATGAATAGTAGSGPDPGRVA